MTLIHSADVLMDEERSTLVAIADEINSLLRKCREVGNYTPEAVHSLETYGPSASYVNNQNIRFAKAFPEGCQGQPLS